MNCRKTFSLIMTLAVSLFAPLWAQSTAKEPVAHQLLITPLNQTPSFPGALPAFQGEAGPAYRQGYDFVLRDFDDIRITALPHPDFVPDCDPTAKAFCPASPVEGFADYVLTLALFHEGQLVHTQEFPGFGRDFSGNDFRDVAFPSSVNLSGGRITLFLYYRYPNDNRFIGGESLNLIYNLNPYKTLDTLWPGDVFAATSESMEVWSFFQSWHELPPGSAPAHATFYNLTGTLQAPTFAPESQCGRPRCFHPGGKG